MENINEQDCEHTNVKTYINLYSSYNYDPGTVIHICEDCGKVVATTINED